MSSKSVHSHMYIATQHTATYSQPQVYTATCTQPQSTQPEAPTDFLSLFAPYTYTGTGWPRPIGYLGARQAAARHKGPDPTPIKAPPLAVSKVGTRATNHRALLRKMTHKDKASYDCTPPRMHTVTHTHVICIQSHTVTHTHIIRIQSHKHTQSHMICILTDTQTHTH